MLPAVEFSSVTTHIGLQPTGASWAALTLLLLVSMYHVYFLAVLERARSHELTTNSPWSSSVPSSSAQKQHWCALISRFASWPNDHHNSQVCSSTLTSFLHRWSGHAVPVVSDHNWIPDLPRKYCNWPVTGQRSQTMFWFYHKSRINMIITQKMRCQNQTKQNMPCEDK
jgi:hypothetical protein